MFGYMFFRLISLLELCVYLDVQVCVWVHEHTYFQKPEKVLDLLEMEFQEVMGRLTWVLGTELRSFAKTVCAQD